MADLANTAPVLPVLWRGSRDTIKSGVVDVGEPGLDCNGMVPAHLLSSCKAALGVGSA